MTKCNSEVKYNYKIKGGMLMYSTYDLSSVSESAAVTSAFAAIAGVIIFAWIIGMTVAVLQIIAMWKIFSKAGEEGWKSIIPVYNIITLFKIAGLSPLLVLVYLVTIIPFIGYLAVLALTVYLNIKLGKAFGKSEGFIVGMILLGPIFYLMLAFGDSTYQLKAGAEVVTETTE